MRNKNTILIALGILALNFALGTHMCTWMNFLKEDLHLPVPMVGLVESLRELPGLFSVLLVAVLAVFAHRTAAGLCLIVFAIGMAGYFEVRGIYSLVLVSMVWSVGFHVWAPFSGAMVLDTAPPGRVGHHVGRMQSVGYAATFAALVMVFGLGELWQRHIIHVHIYRYAYLFGGMVALAGAAASFAISKDIGRAPTRRLLWKREYRLYYQLSFLEGCRKQIFLTLASLVLVKIYNTPVHHIAAMMILYNFANWFGSPWVGKAIDRFGQRPIMTINYAGVMLVFIGYSFFGQWPVLYLLYCMDNLFNVFNIALTTYLQRIALPEDIAPSLAMGMTANHLASVIVPLVACYVWEHVNYRIPFIFGSGIALCLLISAQWVGRPADLSPKAATPLAGPLRGAPLASVSPPAEK